ncbi:non-canonical purine NTP pyrophosphatase [Candidatus Woesearchaeota archaeon]|nr:non-canonical purine NTP pyrophosphatase [Candidatus Woesearchaeota archaeon]
MITFVTSNKNKESEFKNLLPKIEVLKLEYPELKADDPCEISKTAAMTLSRRLGKTVIVEDSGLFIDALNGFPGTSSKYITKRIGNEGILKLMKGVKNRKCQYRSAIGYCEPDKQPLCFIGTEEGRISEKERGKNGWGNDFIFIPKSKNKTYSESKKPGDPGRFRIESIKRLKEYLATRNNA